MCWQHFHFSTCKLRVKEKKKDKKTERRQIAFDMLTNVNERQLHTIDGRMFYGRKVLDVCYLVAGVRYLQFCHLSTLHNARGLAVKRADTQHKCDFCVNQMGMHWHMCCELNVKNAPVTFLECRLISFKHFKAGSFSMNGKHFIHTRVKVLDISQIGRIS